LKIKEMLEKREGLVDEVKAMTELAEKEDRDFTDEETQKYDSLKSEINELGDRITEAEEIRKAEKEIAESREKLGVVEERLEPVVEEITEPGVYHKGGEHSFLSDAFNSRQGDFQAQDRINRHQQGNGEKRDVGTGAFAGLVVPQYLTDLVAEKARGGSPFYNALPKAPLPDKGMKVELSRITTGSTAAFQATQNSALDETNIDDTLYTVNVNTIGGQQDVSRQAIERGTDLEGIVFGDLISAYYTELDNQLINGDGTGGAPEGIRNVTGINTVTYTDASPTVGELYPKLIDAIQKINSNRFAAATAIIMHPRRWGFLSAGVDGNSRPLVLPAGNQPDNVYGVGEAAGYGQVVGQIAGLPVIADANITTSDGGGTNQDQIYVVKADDHILFEETGSPFRLRFDDVGSGSLTVKLVVYGYIAYASGRYPAGISKIQGTGLVTPSF
jgi:HK97 family phage major capsid protein